MWRAIPNIPEYEVSTEGEVRTTKSGKPRKATSEGRRNVTLIVKPKSLSRDVARLVAITWLPLPAEIDVATTDYLAIEQAFKKYEAVHLDYDIRNDAASNLQWMTSSDAKKHRHANPANADKGPVRGRAINQYTLGGDLVKRHVSIKEAAEELQAEYGGPLKQIKDGSTHFGFRFVIDRDDLPGEEWLPISPSFIKEYKGAQASNKGRFKSAIDERIIDRDQATKEYHVVRFGDDMYQVHSLICHVFHADKYFEGAEVNHIDGQIGNNDADNLEWSTRPQNMKHAYATGLADASRKQSVYSIDWLKDIRGPFDSYHNAGKDSGIHYGAIRNSALQATKFTRSQGGFQWTHTAQEADAMIHDPEFDELFSRVIQAKSDGEIVATFEDMKTAATACDIRGSSGINQAATKGGLCKGYRWFKNKKAYEDVFGVIPNSQK